MADATATADPATDPYAGTGFEAGAGRITQADTSQGGGEGEYDRRIVLNSFISFGYYPTEAEIAEFIGAAKGSGGLEAGPSAVAQYVNFQKAEIQRAQNDPLAALQTKMQDSADLMKKQVTGLYQQLQDTLTAAPQLFGNLTPDQIQTYLAPLQTSFKQQLSAVQGTIASRGLTGSSTENNALAQTNEQFQENVLSTGLSVGQQSQQAKASALSAQINSLLGLTGEEESIAANAATTRSTAALGQSNLLASLPSVLNAQAQQQKIIQQQLNPSSGGFFDTFNKVTGAINTGLKTAGNLFSAFAPGGGTPGTPGTGLTSSLMGGGGGANLPASGLIPQTSTAAPAAAALFAAA